MEDFGGMLRRLRVERGWSLRQLGSKAGIDWSYLGRIERGEARCSREWADYCDQALAADGGLVTRWQPTAKNTQAQEGEEETMRRRTLLLGAMTGLAVGASSTGVALEALRHGLGQASDCDTDDWQAIAADYARDFYTRPPGELLAQLAVDLTVLQHVIAAQANADLARVAGQLSAVMAMTLASTGQSTAARRWWRTARTYADSSNDLAVRVWVRDWEVVNGTYENRPLRDILALAEGSVALAAGRVCSGSAGLMAGQAQALAVAGDTTGAVEALHATAYLTERMPADVAADGESMFGWPEVRLRYTESYVYTRVGDTERAFAAQDWALELYGADPTLARERAQMGMHRASCLIQSGHIPDGLRHAAATLDELPVSHHNALLSQMTETVFAVLPPAERRRKEATDLRERFISPTTRTA
ncbi:helix-turn-helix transcriptional regulator [Actinoplanes sp. NPDC051346]|uniref:helix-turn-helix domain-containing protein n=1 Tax=Actinoplanes sp. NPDC051346 TaxID=3155048 RepID=UPI003426BC27